MTTVHAYTATQSIVDGPGGRDYRRGRAAAQNIVPSSTGAAIATTEAIPELAGKFDGIALRVPVASGSMADITAVLREEATVEEINDAFRRAATFDEYQGILTVTEDPIVSSDIVGNPHSAIVDLDLTRVVGNLVKVFAWYDNEAGYSHRVVELVAEVARGND
jgi:glyceraldehyde 3-phosphate dehydrogenase